MPHEDKSPPLPKHCHHFWMVPVPYKLIYYFLTEGGCGKVETSGSSARVQYSAGAWPKWGKYKTGTTVTVYCPNFQTHALVNSDDRTDATLSGRTAQCIDDEWTLDLSKYQCVPSAFCIVI